MADTPELANQGSVALGDGFPQSVPMQFKDGVHNVHEAIVQHLGGAEVLLANQAMFKNKTYHEFMKGFAKLCEQDVIERALNGVINSHLMMHGRIF